MNELKNDLLLRALRQEKLEKPPAQDADEDIETVLFTPGELEKAILAGEPIDAKSISSFFLARPFLT